MPLPGVVAAIAGALMALQAIGGTPYLDLVERYRDGDHEVAVKGLAALPEGRSDDRVIQALEQLVGPTTKREARSPETSTESQLATANIWAAAFPAAAALHLETGYALMRAGELPAARDHLHIAHQLVDYPRFATVMKVRPELGDAQARFRRDVHLGVLWVLQADRDMGRLQQHLDRLRHEYPRDGDVALALGSFEEYQSGSAVIRGLKPPSTMMTAGPFRQNARQLRLKSAEKHYREALKFDASVVEARARLGRILQQRGMLPEARAELERVLAQEEVHAVPRYLASMFLIDVLDAQGQTAAALARARELVARYPECQSSHLALSRALEARGQRVQARAVLWPLWKEEAARTCSDPWWSYYLGQTWRIPALFVSLREHVRGLK